MRDWKLVVRDRLPDLELPPEREAEIVEEIAQLLEDAAQSTDLDIGHPVTFERWLNEQIPDWAELASELDRKKGPRTAKAKRPIRSSSAVNRPDARGFSPFSDLNRDFRQAFRLLSKSPGFTLVTVATLALGIGLNTAMFSLVNYTLLKPVAVNDPSSLVRVYSSEPDGFLPEEPMSFPDYRDIRDTSRTLHPLAAHAMTFVALESDGTAHLTFGELATGNYFEMLGISPAYGRFFDPSDDQISSPSPVVVLSYKTWKRRFGGDEQVIGQDIRINGSPLTVIGVAPQSYVGLWPSIEPEVFLPMALSESLNATGTVNSGSSSGKDPRENRAHRWLWVTGRRTAALEATRDELGSFATSFAEQYPDSNEDRSYVVVPNSKVRISPTVDAGLKTGSIVVMVIVSLVLFIACANVANMLMARALGRRREIATRLSLGASRWHIVRQLVVESLMLAISGGAIGILLALLSNRLINSIDLPAVIPIVVDLTLDRRVLAFTFVIAAATALVFGLLPALQASRTDLNTVLREGDPRVGGGKRLRVQSALVVAQVCLSLALLICAGLSLRSMLNASDMDPGFEPRGLVSFSMDPELQGEDESRTQQIYEDIERELESLPAVESVANSTSLPLTLMINSWNLVPEGQEHLEKDDWPEVDVAWVSGDYFETMEIPLLEGRSFDETDRPASGSEPRRVSIANQAMTDKMWPGESAIGKRVTSNGEVWYEIVGVVGNGKYRTLGEDPRPFLYHAIDQSHTSNRFVIARVGGDAAKALPMVRRAIESAAPGIAVSNLGTAEQAIAPSLFLPRMGARLFGAFGLLGLFLAAIGLYAVLSYLVGQRTHEIGIRIAMGADRSDIVSMVLQSGIKMVALGVVAGLGLAFLISRLLTVILYGISSSDPLTFLAVTVTLVAVSLFACWLPARRASGVDPLTALRHD